MNKLQEMTFGDNDFVTWYENLSEKEQEEVWKEIKKRMEEEYEKFLQSSSEVKDIKLWKPYRSTISSIYKTGEE